MAKAPKSITDPSLHKVWSAAKTTAKASLKKAGKAELKIFTELSKATFKKDLGPNLDKFGKLFPNYPGMEALVNGKIVPAIVAYTKAIKSSSLPKTDADKLIKALADVKKLQAARLSEAEMLINSDVDMAIKASKKKTPPPIVVFQHPDILKAIQSQYGTLTNLDVSGKFSIEVIIGAKEILDKFSESKDYSNASAKIKDAGDFAKLTKAIADAVKAADVSVGKGVSVDKAQKVFESKVVEAIGESVARATKEAARLGGLKANARWANVKRGGRLVLSLAGAAAAIAGLALTPFTGGVSTVAGCIGLAKAGVLIGKQLADIASSAEMMANGIAKDLNTLKKQYDNWLKNPEVKKAGGVSNKMGMAELAKSGLNALAPTLLTTINSVKGDAGTYDEYINNLEVKSDNLADNLDSWLKEQLVADKAFKALETDTKSVLTDKEFGVLKKTIIKLNKSKATVTALITAVGKLNKRVANNRKNAAALNKQIKGIASKNPLWSDVGIVLFETTASVAFTLAGNVNAPDPYQFAKPVMTVVGAIDTSLTALQDAEALGNGLHDAVKKRKSKYK